MASYRLILLLSVVLVGLALLLTMEWPSYTLHLSVFRSPLTLVVSLVWPMIALLTASMALGAAVIFRQHPAMQGEPAFELVALWPLPTLTVSLAALLLPRAASGTVWFGGIAVTGLLLYAFFRLEYICLSTKWPLSVEGPMDQLVLTNSWAEWTLQVAAYLLALIYLVLIYRARLRTLLSVPAILVVSGLLALRLLRDPTSDWRGEGICALVVGLILGEATWALNYWPGRSTVGGVLLFLIFYVFIGLARQGLRDQLTSSALLEYGIVALLGLGLLLRFG